MFLLGCPLTEFVFLEDVQAIFGQCRGGNRCYRIIFGWLKPCHILCQQDKTSFFFFKSWDLFLENGTKWEVEGGLGEYGCKRRPDESVQVIGESFSSASASTSS